MPTPRSRKPRFERIPEPAALRLTERDFFILALVSEHRLLQSHQLTKLVSGSEQHLIRRLGRLFHSGYLDRPGAQRSLAHLPRETFVYTLTERGRRELQRGGIPVFTGVPRLSSRNAVFSLAHDLQVSEAVVALRAGAVTKELGFQMGYQAGDPGQLSVFRWYCHISYREKSKSCLVIPDTAFTLQRDEEAPSWFFLEFDRGTMPVARRDPHQTSFLRKVLTYKETRQGGILWKRDEIPGFRVLVVAESERRLESLRRVTADSFQRGESKLFLFITLEALLQQPSPFDPTWRTCGGQAVALFPS
jgi:hypothetical protein